LIEEKFVNDSESETQESISAVEEEEEQDTNSSFYQSAHKIPLNKI
jgi:hypothetical protein